MPAAPKSAAPKSPARRLSLKGRRTVASSPRAVRHAPPSGELINAILQYADVSSDLGGGRTLLRLSARRREDSVIRAALGREADRLADVAVVWDEDEDEIFRVLDAAAGDALQPLPQDAREEPGFALTPLALAYIAQSRGAA
jgi:hypothetical protein